MMSVGWRTSPRVVNIEAERILSPYLVRSDAVAVAFGVTSGVVVSSVAGLAGLSSGLGVGVLVAARTLARRGVLSGGGTGDVDAGGATSSTIVLLYTLSAGTYFAFPIGTLQSTFVVFKGVGIRTTTFVAESLLLKFVFTVTTYETAVVPISFTVGITRRGSLTFDVERYRISSNSPSGGTKLIVRVESNSSSRTH